MFSMQNGVVMQNQNQANGFGPFQHTGDGGPMMNGVSSIAVPPTQNQNFGVEGPGRD